MNMYQKTAIFFVCLVIAHSDLKATPAKDPWGVIALATELSQCGAECGLSTVLYEKLLDVAAYLRTVRAGRS